MRKLFFLLLTTTLFALPAYTQEVLLEGYVFESGNRGYLNAVDIQINDQISKRLIAKTTSDRDGKFSVPIPPGEYIVTTQKDLFHALETPISIKANKTKEFIKIQMHRKPGYIFDVTLAEKLIKGKEQVDAIANSRIEVYNNTTQEAVMELENHPIPTFKITFERGNHYTIMIRKDGYFTKRLEAYVDVKGCILCFDGVGNVQPGVSDVLTEQNQMGTLLANIELQPLLLNEGFELKNIYYDLNSAKLRPEAEKELKALVGLLKDNPGISVELGAHTDARGDAAYNKKLSQKRAQSVVNYLEEVGKIDRERLVAKGYGETVLINECKDGVKCSEKQHQENRRTELVVLSLEDEDRFNNQRLAEIIQLENLDDEIIEVGTDGQLRNSAGQIVAEETLNTPKKTTAKTSYSKESLAENMGGQIKVASGQALPEEILRDIEKQKTNATTQNSKSKIQSPNNNTRVANSNTQTSNSDIRVTDTNTQIPNNNTRITNTQAPATRASTKQVTTTNTAQATNTKPVYQTNVGETLVKVARPKNNKTSGNQPTNQTNSTSTTPPKAVKIPTNTRSGESTIQRPIKQGKTRKLADNFTGYQVEFLLTDQPVAATNPMFFQHGNIILEHKSSGEYAYLLGDFKEKKDAAAFLREVILPKYATAKLVYYTKGKRVGYVHGKEINNSGMPPR